MSETQAPTGQAKLPLLTRVQSGGTLLLSALAGFVFVVLVLALTDDGSEGVEVSAVGILASLGTFAAALQTLRRQGSARRLWFGSAVVGLGATVFAFVQETEFGFFVMALTSPGFVGAALTLTGLIEVPKSELSGRPRGPVLAFTVLVIAALGAMVVFSRDIVQLRDDLRRANWDDKCKQTGSAHECGYWALYTLSDSSDYDEMRRARAKLVELCEAESSRACALMILTSGAGGLATLDGMKPELKQRRVARAEALCDSGKPGACALVALAQDDIRAITPAAAAGCKKGDIYACWLERFSSQEDEPDAAKGKVLCDAGFEVYCDGWQPSCNGGALDTCEFSYIRNQERFRSDAMYDATAEGDELSAKCDEGSAEACFALGLNVTADIEPFNEPVPLRTLEVTMGKACDGGFDLACRVHAARLLDRPIDEKRDMALAAKLLGQACKRGDAESCWTAATALRRPDKLDELAPLAEAACKQTGYMACLTYLQLRASELDIDPFPHLDQVAIEYVYHGCALGDRRACNSIDPIATEPRGLWTNLHARYVRLASAAQRGCKLGDVDSCRQFIWDASARPGLGIPDADELRTKICAQVPEACESGY